MTAPDPFSDLKARLDAEGPSGNGHVDQADAAALLPVSHAGDQPERPRPPVLVDGLLDQGDLVVLGAGRAVGKSWWGMDLAMQLAQGHGRFMGAFAVRQQARVLYCHGELDDWGAYDRWEKLSGSRPLPSGLAETFEAWRIRVSNRRIQTAPGITDEVLDAILDGRVERTILERGTQVLILDPWAVFYAGRENSNDEVEAALRELRQLQLRHGLSIVILHHFGKATDQAREPEDLWRGASRLADWAATRVTLAPLFTPTQARDQGLSRHQARRYARAHFLRRRHVAPDDMAIRWDVESGQWERFSSTMVEQADQERGGLSVTDMLAKVPDGGWPSVSKAAATLAVSQTTAKRVLEAAVAQGYLEEWKGPRNSIGYRRPEPPEDLTLTSQTTSQTTSHDHLSPLPPERSKTRGDQA